MERSMNASSNGEVYGTSTLYAAMVVGAVALLLGSLWSPAPVNTAAPSAAAPRVQIAAVAPPHMP
jgi:hypothetical protein